MRPLKKREQKYKENAREGNELSPERRKFAGSQKSGIPTGNRTLNLLRLRQGIESKRGSKQGPRRTMTPDYTGPDQHVEKGNP